MRENVHCGRGGVGVRETGAEDKLGKASGGKM